MAFSFYIKPPLILSSYSPINSRSSQQVNGKVFLGLSPNRHILSLPPLLQAVSYTQRLDMSWTLLHGQASPRRLREQPEPSGCLFPCGSGGVWAQQCGCCHPGAVQMSVTIQDADCCDSERGLQPADSIIAQGGKSFLIAARYCNKSVSGLLFHFGICSTQHYSSSTETSESIKWGSGRLSLFQSLYHECSLRNVHSAQLPCPHPACPPLLMLNTLTPTENIYLHHIWWELESKPLKEKKPNKH